MENANAESSSASNTKDALFEPKPKPKMIRVLTVLAYVLSVSMAAILLSIYYIFMWDGRPHLGARRGDQMGIEATNLSETNASPIFSKYVSYEDDFSNMSTLETYNNTHQNMTLLDTQKLFREPRDEEVNVTTDDFNTNITTENNGYSNNQDLQQEITAIESEEDTISSTTIPTTEEASVMWQDDYDDFIKSSIMYNKLLRRYNY